MTPFPHLASLTNRPVLGPSALCPGLADNPARVGWGGSDVTGTPRRSGHPRPSGSNRHRQVGRRDGTLGVEHVTWSGCTLVPRIECTPFLPGIEFCDGN